MINIIYFDSSSSSAEVSHTPSWHSLFLSTGKFYQLVDKWCSLCRLSVNCWKSSGSRQRICLLMSMGWDYASELRPLTGLLFTPRWYMSIESHGGMIATGENSWFVHQSSLAILPASHLVAKQEEHGRKCWTLPTKYLVHTRRVR
jgi:hypothetical protein